MPLALTFYFRHFWLSLQFPSAVCVRWKIPCNHLFCFFKYPVYVVSESRSGLSRGNRHRSHVQKHVLDRLHTGPHRGVPTGRKSEACPVWRWPHQPATDHRWPRLRVRVRLITALWRIHTHIWHTHGSPSSRYLYWSDWNRDGPKIERSGLDGSDRTVLVQDGLGLPNALTFDPQSRRLCWADAGQLHIYSATCILNHVWIMFIIVERLWRYSLSL